MSPSLAYAMPRYDDTHDRQMRCNRHLLTSLLTQQWNRITPERIAQTRFYKHSLALLIEEEYGVHHSLAENYLGNLERALPIHT